MRTAFEETLARVEAPASPRHRPSVTTKLLTNGSVQFGGSILIVMVLLALLAPQLWTADPILIDPIARNKPPGDAYWLGTDSLGRDLYSRIVYGSRISLIVGVVVAGLSLALGVVIGLMSGYIRWLDGIVMRVMDGIMAIPGILLAITLVAVSGASLATVVVAITVPEIPRVVRLVRSVVLSVREEPYVESAVALGTSTPRIMLRHILPNTIAPVIVQGTYICASAIILEALLSFLGAGIPPEIPTWGNTMAEGRTFFMIAPWVIFFPGIALAITVLAVNILGDGLRDTLDPQMGKST